MGLQISRILHAGYVFKCDGTQIAFDTIFENPFSVNCHAFPAVKFDSEQIRQLRFEAVFISHFHDDHCSLESLNLLDRSTVIYVYCVYDEIFDWIRELGFTQVYSLKLNQAVHIGPFEVIPRRALDADVDSLFQIKAAGMNVLNVVDSWIDYDTLDLLAGQKPWDLVLWPFQTMRELEVISPLRAEKAPEHLPAEWIEQLQILNPKNIIPSSCQFTAEEWSWYRKAFFPVTYKKFSDEILSVLPRTRVLRLNPAATIELTAQGVSPVEPLSWIQPVGPQDIDYDYQADFVPPSTAEIAKHFPALGVKEKEQVLDYCRLDLLTKYKSLSHSEDSYFSKARRWRLSLYDEKGEVENFYYQVEKDLIFIVSPNEKIVSWVTEVPMAKVFGALSAGETLTSMYIRINDRFFSEEIEKELRETDIGEDPLIRCLFEGVFGAYQREQLRRLKS